MEPPVTYYWATSEVDLHFASSKQLFLPACCRKYSTLVSEIICVQYILKPTAS